MSLYATCRCGVPEGQEGAHRTDCPLYGVIMMSGPVCRGSWALGTACGRCERCISTKPLTCLTAHAPDPHTEAVEQLIARLSDGAKRILRGGVGQIKHAWELVEAGCCEDVIDDKGRVPFTELGKQVRAALPSHQGAE